MFVGIAKNLLGRHDEAAAKANEAKSTPWAFRTANFIKETAAEQTNK